MGMGINRSGGGGKCIHILRFSFSHGDAAFLCAWKPFAARCPPTCLGSKQSHAPSGINANPLGRSHPHQRHGKLILDVGSMENIKEREGSGVDNH